MRIPGSPRDSAWSDASPGSKRTNSFADCVPECAVNTTPRLHSAALKKLHRLYWSEGLPTRKIECQLPMSET